MKKTTIFALGVSISCAALLTACGDDNDGPVNALTPALACSELAGTEIASTFTSLSTNGATIDQAVLVTADDPANRNGEYCQVNGSIKPVDKSAPDIKVQINLPSVRCECAKPQL